MALTYNNSSLDDKTKSDKEGSKKPISYGEFLKILSRLEMSKVLYEAAISNSDVEIHFEKDRSPKVYFVKKKRIGT